jgi:tetratricopeptide (TPR) repeat protein
MPRNEYDTAFEKAARAASEQLALSDSEARTAKALLPIFLETYPADREAVLADPRYHSLEIARLLLARSRELWMAEPYSAKEAASLAAVIADRLDEGRYGATVLEEVRARAWSYLGNSWRILGDLQPATKALGRAFKHLAACGGDPFLEAEILGFTASLCDSRGQPAAALPLIERARLIYREAGDRRLEGRSLIIKGMLQGNALRYGRAISSTRKGLAQVHLEDDPILTLGGQHNLMTFLAASGRPQKARALIAAKRTLYLEVGHQPLLVKLRWLDGVIARQLGDFGVAESCFWMATEGFLDRGLELDAALAMLEVVEICATQGSRGRAKLLAAEVIPVLEGYGALRQAETARRLYANASG